MALGKLPVPGLPASLDKSREGPDAPAVRVRVFTYIYPFFFLSLSLWEMARYRRKYCLKGSLSPKTTNQPT